MPTRVHKNALFWLVESCFCGRTGQFHYVEMAGLFPCRVQCASCVRLLKAAGTVVIGIVALASGAIGTDDYLIDVWTADNGLPSSAVTAIAQTPDGYLWIGTHNGLVRFDGVKFVNFEPRTTPELKHPRVYALFVDPHGTLWINTYDGSLTSWRQGVFRHEWQGWQGFQLVSMFPGSNQTVFAAFSGEALLRIGPVDVPGQWLLVNPPGKTTGMAWRQDNAGLLWYYTREGVLGQLVGTNFAGPLRMPGLEGNTVTCLTTDQAGNIWIGTDRAFGVWDGTKFIDRTPTNDEQPVAVTFMLCTGDGGCWVLGNGRLRKCMGQQWVTEIEGWGSYLGEYPAALHAFEDRQGGVWFCHYGHGIFHVRPDGELRRITSARGLPGDRVSCWLQDREGNFWVGVDRGGLVRLRERRFRVIGPAHGLPAQVVMTVCEDSDGAIWLGTGGGGLNQITGRTLSRFDLPDGASRAFVFSAHPDPTGRLWLSAGREDLRVFERGRFVSPGVQVHGIKAIFVDRHGQVWMGKNNGLACLSAGTLREFGLKEGLNRTAIRAIAEDKHGRIWIGGDDGILYQLDSIGEGRFMSNRPPDALPGEAIWSLLADEDGTIWVGTFRGGLLRFKSGQFKRYTSADGLPSDVICQILDDGRGNLWIGSDKGIFHVSKILLHKFDRGKGATLPCIGYGIDDGLPTMECTGGYQPACWRARDGTLWFTTVKGAVSLRPDDVPFNRVTPSVVIEEVLLDGRTVKDARHAAVPQHTARAARGEVNLWRAEQNVLCIPSGRHRIEFHYTAPSFVSPHRMRFRYRLDGFDCDWVDAGDRRVAEYGNLPPGQYLFCVTACNNSGVWNKPGTSLVLKVIPRFWETLWFRILAGLVSAAGLVGTARAVAVRRLRRKLMMLERDRAVERERARIAKDIHDELGAGLTQIMLQSALAQRTAQADVPVHLRQIAERARELIRQMDEIVWAVNPRNDTLESLATYISKYAQEYLSTAGIRCRFDLPESLPAHAFSAEVRHNLFLATKEALHNVVKHAHASEVKLKMALQPGLITLTITDNGRGFGETGPGSEGTHDRFAPGQGIKNMEKRLESIGGACVVRSQPGHGTTVEMIVPIDNRPAAQKCH